MVAKSALPLSQTTKAEKSVAAGLASVKVATVPEKFLLPTTLMFRPLAVRGGVGDGEGLGQRAAAARAGVGDQDRGRALLGQQGGGG
jgi:hypothetical protein